jgi:hypothetical protein
MKFNNKETNEYWQHKTFYIFLLVPALFSILLLCLSFEAVWPEPTWGVKVVYTKSWPLETRQRLEIIAFDTHTKARIHHRSQAWLLSPQQGDLSFVASAPEQTSALYLDLPPTLTAQQAKIKLQVQTPRGKRNLELPVDLINPVVLGVLRDKPHYQPGETVKVRVLARQGIQQKPLKNAPIQMTLFDPRGSELYQVEKTSSEWGVVSFAWDLAEKVTQGTYALEIKQGDTLLVESFEVQQTELPPVHFDTQFQPASDATSLAVAVSARDAFGETLIHQTLSLSLPGLSQRYEAITNAQGIAHFSLPRPPKDSVTPLTAVLQVKNGLYPWYHKTLELPTDLKPPHFQLWKLPGYHAESRSPGGVLQAFDGQGTGLSGLSVYRQDAQQQYQKVGTTNAAGLWVLSAGLSPVDPLWIDYQGKKQQVPSKYPDFLDPTSAFTLALPPVASAHHPAEASIRVQHAGNFSLHCAQGSETLLYKEMSLQADQVYQVPLPPPLRRGTRLTCQLYQEYFEPKAQVSAFIPAEPLTVDWLQKEQSYRPGQTPQLRLQTRWKGQAIPAAASLRIYDGRLDALSSQEPFDFSAGFSSENKLKEALDRFPKSTHESLLSLYQTQAYDAERWQVHDTVWRDIDAAHRMTQHLPTYTFQLILFLLSLTLWLAIFRAFASFSRVRRQPYQVMDPRLQKQLRQFHRGLWWLFGTPTLALLLFIIPFLFYDFVPFFLMHLFESIAAPVFYASLWVFPLLFLFLFLRQMVLTQSLLKAFPRHFHHRILEASLWILWSFILASGFTFIYLQGMRWSTRYPEFYDGWKEWIVPGVGFVSMAAALLALFLGGYLAYWWSHPKQAVRPRWPWERVFVLCFVLPLTGLLLMPNFIGAQDRASGYRRHFGVQTQQDSPRRYFPRSLFFAPVLVSNPEGVIAIPLTLPDNLSQWQIEGEAWTAEGHSAPIKSQFVTSQPLSVSLEPVQQIKAGQRVFLPLLVRNRSDSSLEVKIQAKSTPLLQVLNELNLRVPAHKTQRVFLPIRSLKAGKAPLTLTAIAAGTGLSDQVEQVLTLAPAGFLQENVSQGVLEPGATQSISVPQITGSHREQKLMFSGGFDMVLQGLENIFKMPYGCFEQTSSTTYPNALVLRYLNQELTPQQKEQALDYLQKGYQRILSFEVESGGFSMYGKAPASEYLSAYGLLELTDMARVIKVDPAVIQRLGGFLNHGLENISDPDEKAYVLWAMAEAGQTQSKFFKDALAQQRQQIQPDDSPYLLALHANTLLAMGDRAAEVLVFLKQQMQTADTGIYWAMDRPTIYGSQGITRQLETTALVTLAFSRTGYAPDIVSDALNFMRNHRDSNGTWHNTQATVLVLKALVQQRTERLTGQVIVSFAEGKQQILTLGAQGAETNLALIQGEIELRSKSAQRLYYQRLTRTYTPEFKALHSSQWDVQQHWNAGEWSLDINSRVDNDSAPLMLTFDMPIGYALEPGWLEHLQGQQHIDAFEQVGHTLRIYLPVLPAKAAISLPLRWRSIGPVDPVSVAMTLYDYYTPEQKSQFLVNLQPLR